MNKKANLPALAILVLAILFALIVITVFPTLKETALEIIRSAT